MNGSMYGIKEVRIAKLVVQQTGTYGQQYRRSYGINLTGALQNQLEEAVVSMTKLAPATMVTSTDQLIVPTADPEAAIDIVNGWEVPRLRFFMRIEATDQMGGKTSTIVTGYTEYAELSFGNHFDPRMQFFINNVTQTRLTTYNAGLGTVGRYNVAFSHQLVSDSMHAERGYLSNPKKNYAMTPTSMFSNMSNLDLIGAAQFSEEAGSMLMDTTSVVDGKAKHVNRTHGLGTQYMADMLNTYLGTKATMGESGSYSTDDFYNTCRNTARAMDGGKEIFLDFIAGRHASIGWGGMGATSFNFNDLLVFDPGVTNVCEVIPISSGQHTHGQSDSWGSSGPEAVFASTLANGVSSLMSQFAFMSISFRSTNYASIQREHLTIFQGVNGLNNSLNQANELAAFRYRLETEVLNPLSYNNQMGYEVEVTADINGEIWMEITLDGYGRFMFVLPAFCDGMMTPMVTMNRGAFDKMTMSLAQLGEGLSEVKAHSTMSPNQDGLHSFETGRTMYNL